MVNASSAEEVAEELFLSTLTRFPEPDEIRMVTSTLEGANSPEARESACRNLAWAAIASIEFFTNH